MPNYPLWDQLNQLKEAEWVDLTHTFDPEIPRFSEFEKGEVSTLFTVKEHGFTCNVEYRHSIWYTHRCTYSLCRE